MNVIIQPVHLLLYMSLISTANELVARNPIYALVAIGFLIPAEKFIKRMFGLDKASSTSDFGSFAKNALAYEGLKKVDSAFSGGAKKAVQSAKGASSNSENIENSKFNKIRRAELGSFAANTGDESNTNESIDKNGDDGQEMMKPNGNAHNQEDVKENFGKIDNAGYSKTDSGIFVPGSLRQDQDQKRARQERLDKEQAQQKKQEEKQKIDVSPNNTPQIRRGYKRRIAGRVGKAIGKGVLRGTKIAAKGALKTGFAVGGASIGLASAIVTGDASNVAKYTLTGAYAGSSIGKGVANLPENLIEKGKSMYQGAMNTYDQAVDAINEEKYGYSGARDKRIQKENERARKEFLKDKKQVEKYTDIAGQIGYKGDVKDLMNAALDYKEAGVDDEMIKNALKVEQKRDKTVGGDNHNKMIDIASFATENGYEKSDILNEESRSNMEDIVQSTIAEKDRYEVMKSIADLYGKGDFYSKNSRFKKPPIKKG